MRPTACILAGTLLALPLSTRADGDTPDEVLTACGLRKVGVYYILPAEKEVAAALDDLKPVERRLRQAIKQRDTYEAHVNRLRIGYHQALAEHLRLSNMLRFAESPEQYEQLVYQLNTLSTRIRLLHREIEDAPASEWVGKALSDAGRNYVEAVDKLSRAAKTAVRRYEELSSDPAVTEALAALAAETDRPFKLGPRRVFVKTLDRIEQLAAAVETSVVPVQRKNDILMIDTVLNGKTAARMVFDTGASKVFIPESVAAEAGIEITEHTPTGQAQVADGRRIETKLVLLESLRVGPFTIENVECCVLPSEMGDAHALLGGSFLRHFQVEVDHNAEQVTLTRLKTPSGTTGSPKR